MIGEVLGDRLDDEVDVGERLALGRAGEAAEHGGLAGLVDLALLDELGQALVDEGDDTGDLVLAAADEDHVVAGLREDLDDARGHGAGADDADRARSPA